MTVVYDWDANKARNNLKKHGISFEEATEVFEDPSRVIEPNYHYDDETEPRFQAIGATRRGDLILLVVFVDRTRTNEETETIVLRLISARKANAYETQLYIDAREA